MNKYIYAECTIDYWPSLKTISAKSYNDAVERIITKYGNKLNDDKLLNFEYSEWEDFRDYLNDEYSIALSDLELYEEL